MKLHIRQVSEQGKLIVLEDTSKWTVSSFDAFNTRMWLAGDSVTVSGSKMTNHNRRDQSVSVTRKF